MVGEIATILEALNREGARYLIVGGVAAVLHGHLRTTADLDLVLQLERENVLRGLRALDRVGYRPRAPVPAESFADRETREAWIREKGLTVFSFWSSAGSALSVDLFVAEPFDFDAAYARAPRLSLGSVEAPVLALDDLIEMKTRAGRPIDAADVEALRAIRGARGPA
jgi:hypothetical protein